MTGRADGAFRRDPVRHVLQMARNGAVALCAMALLAGCSSGEFGRPRQLFPDTSLPTAFTRHSQTDPSLALAGLTDDERRMRDLAYSLIIAPDNGHGIRPYIPVEIDYAAVLENDRGAFDRTAYARRLVSVPARSEEMRYSRLLEDVRNDVTMMEQFFAVARNVADMDRRREQSFAYVSDLTEVERAQARERIRQNGLVVFRVMAVLDERVAGYRYALERLAISAPSPTAAQADRALSELKQRIADARPRVTPALKRAA